MSDVLAVADFQQGFQQTLDLQMLSAHLGGSAARGSLALLYRLPACFLPLSLAPVVRLAVAQTVVQTAAQTAAQTVAHAAVQTVVRLIVGLLTAVHEMAVLP